MDVTDKPKPKTYPYKIIYFKESGKYYTEAKFERPARDGGVAPLFHDVVAHIVGLNEPGSALPGLTGTWDHAMLIFPVDHAGDEMTGEPRLILPKSR